MFCTKCGKQLPDSAVFCPSCGTAVRKVSPGTPAAAETEEAANTTAAAKEEKRIFWPEDILHNRDGSPAEEAAKVTKEALPASDDNPAIETPVSTQETVEKTPAPSPAPAAPPAGSAPGMASAPAGGPVPQQNYPGGYQQTGYAAPVKKPKKKNKALTVILVLLLLAAAAYFAYPFAMSFVHYNQAVKLYDAGSYDEALVLFEELSEKEFRDSSDYAHKILYKKASDALSAGELKTAAEYFVKLREDGYRDSAAQLDGIFSQMLGQIESGNYDALDINSVFVSASYPGSENVSDYADGMKALEEGRNYDAYLVFTGLSGFASADSFAEKCIVPRPSSSILYDSGQSGNVDLKIEAPSDEDCYAKIYKDGTLMVTMFVRQGESCTASSLPEGNYSINVGYRGDSANWYGPSDMFGDEGYYEKEMLSGNSYEAYLENGYIYTLSLHIGEGSVGTEDAGRGDI